MPPRSYPHPVWIVLLAACLPVPVFAQPQGINSLRKLQRSAQHQPELEMVELKQITPSIRYDLRYAGSNNFVGKPMYPAGTACTYLRRDPALALKRAQAELAENGLGLKIWDAYRPYSVTVAFWKLIGDERYVANPAKGSGHNRGIAVDLTLIRLDTGEELPMGTGFDHFSDTAHQNFTQLPEEMLQNRQLLRTTMEKNGFRPYAEEWWHYSWPEPQRFEVLDIPFQKLKRIR